MILSIIAICAVTSIIMFILSIMVTDYKTAKVHETNYNKLLKKVSDLNRELDKEYRKAGRIR
jgi:hypothetical protein